MTRPRGIPKYREHKPSKQALVELAGKRHYLGRYNSPESWRKYRQKIAEYTAQSGGPPVVLQSTLTVGEPLWAYHKTVVLKHFDENGKPTSEQYAFKTAFGPVQKLYGAKLVSEFGPLALIACRRKLIDRGLCRAKINKHVQRIRHTWRWGVQHEMVRVENWQALTSIEGLKRGEAFDPPKVQPVPIEHVVAIEGRVSPHVWSLIQFQFYTACRPTEACMVRGAGLKMTGDVWEYRPESHKTEHRGKDRVIAIGPRLQEIVKPWLRDDQDEYLWQARESLEWHHRQRAAKRKTRRTPSQLARDRKRERSQRKRQREPGKRFTRDSYRQAVAKACKRAGVPHWSPHRLRHTVLTRIREDCGVESAMVVGGHGSISTTEIYAERDLKRAREVMRNHG